MDINIIGTEAIYHPPLFITRRIIFNVYETFIIIELLGLTTQQVKTMSEYKMVQPESTSLLLFDSLCDT